MMDNVNGLFALDVFLAKSYILYTMVKLSRKDVFAIAIEAIVDPRTVTSIYEGKPSRGLVRGRVEAAAKKLRLAPPPSSTRKESQS